MSPTEPDPPPTRTPPADRPADTPADPPAEAAGDIPAHRANAVAPTCADPPGAKPTGPDPAGSGARDRPAGRPAAPAGEGTEAPSTTGAKRSPGRSGPAKPRAWLGWLLAPLPLVAYLALFLSIVVAHTRITMFAGIGLALVASVGWIVAVFGRPGRWRSGFARWCFRIDLFLGLFLLLQPALLAPPGVGGDAGLIVAHERLGAAPAFSAWSPANWIPEGDQANLALEASAWSGGLPRRTARRWQVTFLPYYHEIQEDEAFKHMGSVLGRAYGQALGERPAADHYVVLMPRAPQAAFRDAAKAAEAAHGKGGAVAGRRIPVFVFLHGFGGNLQAYWMALAPLARAHGFAVLAPTRGYGSWTDAGARAVADQIDATLAHAAERYAIDPERVYLIGFSAGGRGVSRLIRQRPGRWRGAVFLGAVIDPGPEAEAGAWTRLPVLVLHGEADRIIPPATNAEALQTLRRWGAWVEAPPLREADHMLLFEWNAPVHRTIRSWLRQTTLRD